VKRLLAAFLIFALPLTVSAQAPRRGAEPLYLVDHYDPTRNPTADVRLAVARAQTTNRRILLIVGGDWCGWCFVLDRFLAEDAETRAAMTAAFVMLKINMSAENENEAFLAPYRMSGGYPAFVVLDSDGSYLRTQDTGEFEQGHSYSRLRLVAFANRWRR